MKQCKRFPDVHINDHPFYLRAVASPKHFIGNNNEVGRGERSVSLDPRNMRESYLKAFELTFREGGAQSMMTSYNSVNGVPANLNPDINAVVKREWGMDGFVVSDAGDVLGTVNDHKYMADYKQAVAASIRAGVVSITDDHGIVKQAIRDGLAEGLLAEGDHVDGHYVRIRGDGKLAADGSAAEVEVFSATDWGWRAHTFVARSTGLYATTDDAHLTADSREIFGWFTKEAFLVDREEI